MAFVDCEFHALVIMELSGAKDIDVYPRRWVSSSRYLVSGAYPFIYSKPE